MQNFVSSWFSRLPTRRYECGRLDGMKYWSVSLQNELNVNICPFQLHYVYVHGSYWPTFNILSWINLPSSSSGMCVWRGPILQRSRKGRCLPICSLLCKNGVLRGGGGSIGDWRVEIGPGNGWMFGRRWEKSFWIFECEPWLFPATINNGGVELGRKRFPVWEIKWGWRNPSSSFFHFDNKKM